MMELLYGTPQDSDFELLEYIMSFSYEMLDDNVIHQAKRALLDNLGAIAAGAFCGHEAEALKKNLAYPDNGDGCTVFSSSTSTTCAQAAFLNACFAQVHDYNDGFVSCGELGGSYHPGRVIIPTTLSASEKAGATGKEFIAAMVMGYDVAGSLRWELPAPPLPPKADISAATAIAGKLFGLSYSQLKNSFGMSEFLCPCIQPRSVLGTSADYLVFASIARTGIETATLISSGLTGAPTGFKPNLSKCYAAKGFGNPHDIMNLYFKPYPACRTTHAAVEMIIELKKKMDISADTIESVTVFVPEESRYIDGLTDENDFYKCGEFRMQYPVACTIMDGELTVRQFSQEHMADPKVHVLERKVKVVVDGRLDAVHSKAERHFGLELVFKNGEKHSFFSRIQKGHPSNPMTDSDLEHKFIDSASDYISKEQIDNILNKLWQLEKLASIKELTEHFKLKNNSTQY